MSSYLSSLQTLVGNFVQVGPDGSKTKGDFYIQKPGKVRFEYDAPSPIAIIADGSSLAVRDRKLATQDIYPLSQTPLRFLLSDRIDLLKDTNVVNVTADDVFISVTIEEKQALIGTSRLDADGRRQGRPAQAMDRDRPAGLRHHGRGLQSGFSQEGRSRPVQDRLSPTTRRRRAENPILACGAMETCVISRTSSALSGPHAFLPDNLEYQFGAAAHRSSSPNSSNRRGRTCCACRKPNASTTPFR